MFQDMIAAETHADAPSGAITPAPSSPDYYIPTPPPYPHNVTTHAYANTDCLRNKQASTTHTHHSTDTVDAGGMEHEVKALAQAMTSTDMQTWATFVTHAKDALQTPLCSDG